MHFIKTFISYASYLRRNHQKYRGDIVDFYELKKIIESALTQMHIRDRNLLQSNREWAISAKLGMYLHNELQYWDVDCEYNKVGSNDDPKRMSNGKKSRPDITIHKRECIEIENNLLYIEVKFLNSEVELDMDKLIDFTSPSRRNRNLQYQYSASISFFPEVQVIWLKDGRRIEIQNLTTQIQHI